MHFSPCCSPNFCACLCSWNPLFSELPSHRVSCGGRGREGTAAASMSWQRFEQIRTLVWHWVKKWRTQENSFFSPNTNSEAFFKGSLYVFSYRYRCLTTGRSSAASNWEGRPRAHWPTMIFWDAQDTNYNRHFFIISIGISICCSELKECGATANDGVLLGQPGVASIIITDIMVSKLYSLEAISFLVRLNLGGESFAVGLNRS